MDALQARVRRGRRHPAGSAAHLIPYMLLALFLALCLHGCVLLGATAPVVVAMPATPEAWLDAWGEPGYLVQWRCHAGCSGEASVPVGSSQVVVELPRAGSVAVVAWPVWESGGPGLAAGECLCPAGVVWSGPPLNHVTLSYEGGAVAWVLADAARRGVNIAEVNSERLVHEVSERMGSDPWLVDTQRIVRALCERSMRVSYIRERELEEVTASIPEGTWFPASPFADALTGGEQVLALPVGITAVYDAVGRRLVLEMDDAARLRWVISPPG